MRLLIFALLLIAAPAAAQDMSDPPIAQDERILSFVSDVTVEPDGDLNVTETIRVRVAGQEIRRGIQRDFPTSYDNPYGQTTRVGFELLSVKRDGQEEPAEEIGLSNGVRIRIGQADVLLPYGEHVYQIRYRTTRQIRYGGDEDEFYWNATGTGWTFPIDVAEARIRLPRSAAFGSRAFYTGPQGATGRDAEVIDERPGFIVFRTTRPLGREEGLTVAAAFPKGVLEVPGAGRRLAWWLADWGALTAGVIAALAILGYYLRAWARVGRGPRAGPVVPRFSPPDGLSAAACRYIDRMALDDRAFTAAIVDLGVRGELAIRREPGGWLTRGDTVLERRPGGAAELPAPERAMLASLFGSRDIIALKQSNHQTLQSARSALGSGLDQAYAGRLFKDHRGWAHFGLALVPVAMFAVGWLSVLFREPRASIAEILVPLAGLALIVCAWILHRAASRRRGMASALLWVPLVILATIGLTLAFFSTIDWGQWAVLLPLLSLPIAISAYWWMYAPTPEGRTVMDRIAGFRHYLGITEEERLDALHPPEKTPELFERYLPYAIALDVENRWANRFVGVLAAAAAAGAATHTAAWYSGDDDFWRNPGGFADSVGSSLTSAVSSAATSPSSSSGGSSGGGSSGGGGGGGGGSGW